MGKELILQEVSRMFLSPNIAPAEVARKMVPMAVAQRALVISHAFSEKMERVSEKEANDAWEKYGQRSEAVLDELDEFTQTLRELIVQGDTEIVLSMVRGRAGEFSSAAEHFTQELIQEFFAKDEDMQSTDENVVMNRLINVAWTFMKETPVACRGINQFFLFTEEGQELVDRLNILAKGGDEEAFALLRNLEERKEEVGEAAPDLED